MPRDFHLNRERASSKTGKIFLLFTFFFRKIDFYISGAIKVVLAQILMLNSGEQTSYCSVFLTYTTNTYFQPLQEPS